MSEFQFLSAEKQRLMLQNRFDISFSKFHKVLDNKLTILPCNNMYEALSYAYTGLLKYGETFRQKILTFMKNSWINPTLLEAFEKELNSEGSCRTLESYIDEQMNDFISSPSPPFLEVKAAATYLQVAIHVFVPDESENVPKYTFRPIVKNLRKSVSDPCNFDEKDSIVISAEKITQDRYEYGAVVSFPYNSNPKQKTHTSNQQDFLKDFFVQNTSPSKAAEICEKIGYPKLKYYGKRRPGVNHTEMLDKVFSEWYPVAEIFCKRVGLKPSTLLARSYWINDEKDVCKTLDPQSNHQRIGDANRYSEKLCQIIQKHFMNSVKPAVVKR